MTDTNSNTSRDSEQSPTAVGGFTPTDTPKGVPNSLNATHLQHLLDSGISPQAIAARGYFSVENDANGKAKLRELGFDSKQSVLLPSIVIPLHNWQGAVAGHAIRPDIPRIDTRTDKWRKYELATGSTNTIDIAVLTGKGIYDPTVDLIITEGAKKADAAASHGLVAGSLNGVHGLRGRNSLGGIGFLPELDEIVLKGTIGDKPISRRVFMAFDSDWTEKDAVYRALRTTAAALERRGATVKMVNLQPGPNGEKTGLDDYFARGGTAKGLFELATDLVGVAERQKQKAEAKKVERKKQVEADAKAREVPVVEINGRQLLAKLRDLSKAVALMNERSPQLFRGLEGLVYVSHDALESASIRSACRAKMQTLATESAIWVSTSEREGVSQVSPPRDLCENYLVSEGYWQGVPSLERVAEAPFFAPDGTLCDRTGYYEAAKAWLSLPVFFDIGDTSPTAENIQKAKEMIFETILGEAPFADDASKAHAVALMLLPFIRRMIPAPTPLHLFNAPLRGSGKTYIAELCISPFALPSAQSEKGNLEEWRKALFSKLLQGASHYFIDNITGSLNSPTLDMAITAHSGYIEDRLTGTGDVLKAPTRCVWVATANNAQLTEDAANRTIVIQIDPNCENPGNREFKNDPANFIKNNRAAVCGALITLVRAWLEAGRPKYSGTNACRFPLWRDIMGGILDVAEIPGFLDNIKSTQEDIAFSQANEWHQLTELWYAEHGDRAKNAQELLPLALKVADLAASLQKHEGPAKARSFGQILNSKRDRVYGDFKIVKGPEVDRKKTFKLLPQINQNVSSSSSPTEANGLHGGLQQSAVPKTNNGTGNGYYPQNGHYPSATSGVGPQSKLFDHEEAAGVDI